MIELDAVVKRYDHTTAVDSLSFRAEPGRVTGLLGPNGAGKTTTFRILLGLATADAGTALIDGQPYAALARPKERVGAVLESSGFHPTRSGRDHLRVVTTAAGLPWRRCDEVLDEVGLAGAASRAVGGYSLGMRQRLGLASALLGDPQVLVLDEPTNGLDPVGVAWVRALVRNLAADGRCVIVASHLLAEIALTVDDVVIIDRGRAVHHGPMQPDRDPARLEQLFLSVTSSDPSVA